MATMITEECINCGACEPECPNTAIYQGGVEWEMNGVKHPPLSNDVFYIVPEKCTECVGFHDQEACAAVCPVDVCIPNPDIPESEEVLLARARELHPDVEFPADFPSRFRAAGAAAPAESPAAASEPAAAPPPPKPAPESPKPAAAAKAATRTEKPLSPPAKPAPLPPRVEKSFPGELNASFEDTLALLETEKEGRATLVKWVVALAQPLLGALPYKQKTALERAIADRRFFTAAGATGLNALHNMILYPALFAALGALALDRPVFSANLNWLIFLGLVVGSVETMWRMREGFRGRPAEQIVFRAAAYGLPLAPLAFPFIGLARGAERQGSVGQDGFRDPRFEDKLERERRYGEVYRLHQKTNGFLLEFEFPRTVPPSGVKEEMGLPDEMPDYDYDLALRDGSLVVKGKVSDGRLRKVAAVSPAFPPDFTTRIQLPSRVAGFRHRFRGKILEVALPRKL
jgi:ferredoxin